VTALRGLIELWL